MSIGVLGLGLVLAAAFAVFYWLRIFATLTAVLGLIAVVMLGGNGVIGAILIAVMRWLVRLVNDASVWAFGGAITAAVFLFLAVVFIHDLHPRHAAGRRTAHIGLALGLLLVAGLTGFSALSGAAGGIQHSTLTVFSNL